MYFLCYILAFLPLLIILPVKVFGKKNIAKKQNYVIVFNHQSNFDGVLLNFKLKKRIRYIAKQELWKGKEKSFLFDTILDCVKVDRSKGLTVSNTKRILNYLKNGKCVGIAPEGTRIEGGLNENSDIKNGACLFAIKSKTPILPCYIDKKQKAFRKNTIVIGKPFELDNFYDIKLDKENLNKAGDVLLDKLNELKNEFKKEENERKLLKQLKKDKKNNKNIFKNSI